MTVPRLAAILAIVAGCSSGPDLAAPADVLDDDPRVLACREEARNTPERQEIYRRAGPGADPEAQTRRELDQAIGAAFRACLEREGLVRPGGVERVREPVFAGPRPGFRAPAQERYDVLPPLSRPAPTGY